MNHYKYTFKEDLFHSRHTVRTRTLNPHLLSFWSWNPSTAPNPPGHGTCPSTYLPLPSVFTVCFTTRHTVFYSLILELRVFSLPSPVEYMTLFRYRDCNGSSTLTVWAFICVFWRPAIEVALNLPCISSLASWLDPPASALSVIVYCAFCFQILQWWLLLFF